jgi:FlaG/FlaF family flagellin (archaellin)
MIKMISKAVGGVVGVIIGIILCVALIFCIAALIYGGIHGMPFKDAVVSLFWEAIKFFKGAR